MVWAYALYPVCYHSYHTTRCRIDKIAGCTGWDPVPTDLSHSLVSPGYFLDMLFLSHSLSFAL
eukprot:12693591-Heterocapsa_arctica.AAC.1